MFERFTDRARRVVVLAQDEARLLNHNYIGTEHFLLALLHDDESVAGRALEACGVSLGAARNATFDIIGTGPPMPPVGHIPFTPRAKKVLELSLREAMHLGHDYIGTEHILLGVIREGEGVGAQVLVRLGADLSSVRQVVVKLLSGGRSEPASPTWRVTQSEESLGPARMAVTAARGFGPPQGGACSFCGGDLWDLGYVVAGNGAVICEECTAAAGVAVADARAENLAHDVPLHLPARASGVIPDETAVRAIQDAFAEVFGGRDPDASYDDVLEDAAVLAPSRHELRMRVPQAAGAVTHVERIRFDAPDRARVRFTIMPRGIGAFRFEGDAIRRGDRWMVSRDTWCEVAARGGVQCPPRSE